MSRRSQRSKHRAARSLATPAPAGQDVSPKVEHAYSELLNVLTLARVDAEQQGKRLGVSPDIVMDLTKAYRVLDAHPELTGYLMTVKERAEARAEALGLSVDGTAAAGTRSLSRDYGVPGQSGFTIKEAPTQSNPRDQQASGWTGSKGTAVGIPNARILREWADRNEWVRAAINIRRQRIGRADIKVAAIDPRKKYDKKIQQQVSMLLQSPNEYRQNWSEFIGSVLEDVLVLDRGVISKGMTVDRKPANLYCEDGATVKIYPNWNGDPDVPRYLYEDPGGQRKVPLRNDECIVIMAGAASYRYGLSPVQVLRDTIQADLRATASAMHLVDMKPPPHMIQIPKAKKSLIEDMREKYDSEIAGRKELFWIGGDEVAHVFPLVFSAKDMQWLDWQIYLARKIATIFQISPQQLGLTMDINRANGEVQQEIANDTGLIPLMLTVEDYLNEEILADFAPLFPNGRPNTSALNLRIVFPDVTDAVRRERDEQTADLGVKALAGLPSMTLNQLLIARGEEPVRGGNTFWVNTKAGPVPFLSYDNDLGNYTPPPPEPTAPASTTAPTAPKASNDPNDDDEAATPSGGHASPAESPESAAAANRKAILRAYQVRELGRRLPGRIWSAPAFLDPLEEA